MRYYLMSVQYNKEAQAENRTVPKAYDTEEEAICAFHKQMGTDMANTTLGWAFSMVIDSNCTVIRAEKWVDETEEEATEESTEETEA